MGDKMTKSEALTVRRYYTNGDRKLPEWVKEQIENLMYAARHNQDVLMESDNVGFDEDAVNRLEEWVKNASWG